MPSAHAFSIFDYSVFSYSDVFLGGNVRITDGEVGTDADMTIENDVDISRSVNGQGNLNSSINLRVDEDVTFNGDVTIDHNARVKGNLDSGGNVTLDKTVTVDKNVTAAGNVDIDQNSRVKGNMDSGGNVLIRKDAKVDGAITATGTITLQSGASAGSQNPGGSPQSPQSYVSPGLPAITSFSAGVVDVIKGNNQSTILAPTSYNVLDLGNANDLFLSSGVYYFGSVNIGRDSKIHIDLTGASKNIEIYVLNNATLDQDIFMLLNSGTGSNVYWETHGSFEANEDRIWYGTYYTPYSTMTFDKNSRICGALYSEGKLTLAEDTSLDFCSPYQKQNFAPEPATLSLLGLGFLGALNFPHNFLPTTSSCPPCVLMLRCGKFYR